MSSSYTFPLNKHATGKLQKQKTDRVVGGRDDILIGHASHVHSRLEQLLKLAQPLGGVRLSQRVGKPGTWEGV